MLLHPLVHFETSRQRQNEVLARAELHRVAKEARTATQDDYGRLIEARALNKRRPPTRTVRPQRANS